MSSLEKKYACQESKFLTTLGTTIYAASRAEKTKNCSDVICGERGSFANPVRCLGEAFELAKSKAAGTGKKFDIEILTKDIVGSEEAFGVVVPNMVESINGVASGTTVKGLDSLSIPSAVTIENLQAPRTYLTIKPEPAAEAVQVAPMNVRVFQSTFRAMEAEAAGDDTGLIMAFNDVDIASGPISEILNARAGAIPDAQRGLQLKANDRANIQLVWDGGNFGTLPVPEGDEKLTPAWTLAADNSATVNVQTNNVNLGGEATPTCLGYTSANGGIISVKQQGGTQILSALTANFDPTSSFSHSRSGLDVAYLPDAGAGADRDPAGAVETFGLRDLDFASAKETQSGRISLLDENVKFTLNTSRPWRSIIGKNIVHTIKNTIIRRLVDRVSNSSDVDVNVLENGEYKESWKDVQYQAMPMLAQKTGTDKFGGWSALRLGDGAMGNIDWVSSDITAPRQKRAMELGTGASMKSTQQLVAFQDAGADVRLAPAAQMDLLQADVKEGGDDAQYANSWKIEENAILSRRKTRHKATINGENPLDAYDAADVAGIGVSEKDGTYTVMPSFAVGPDGTAAPFAVPFLMSVATTNAKFSYLSNGTTIKAVVDLGNNLKNAKSMPAGFLVGIEANGTSQIMLAEQGVSKNLQGISDMTAQFNDETIAKHSKKLGEEEFTDLPEAANMIKVAGGASFTQTLFGSQISSFQESPDVVRTLYSVATTEKAAAHIQGATNTLTTPNGKALELSGPQITVGLQGGTITGDISSTVPAVDNAQAFDPETEPESAVAPVLSSVRLNGVEHRGKTFVSGLVKAIFSSGSTKGHVDARDGCILQFLNYVHEGSDPSKPLIRADNAREIKKSVYTAVLRKVQSAITGSGDQPLIVSKDLVKLEPENDYRGVAYDYRNSEGPVRVALGNLNAGPVLDFLRGKKDNPPKITLAPSGTFSLGAAIKDAVLDELATAPQFKNAP